MLDEKRYRACYNVFIGSSGHRYVSEPLRRDGALEMAEGWIEEAVKQPVLRAVLCARMSAGEVIRVKGKLAAWDQWIEEVVDGQ